MQRTEIKDIVERWIFPTVKSSYMGGVEDAPVLAQSNGTTVTDTEGRYRIDNIPAGSYTLIAWNEGTSSDARPVMVPEGGVAELDFAVR